MKVRITTAIFCLGVGALFRPGAQAQLRIVQYNCGVVKNGTAMVLQQLGHESVNGIARPPDVLLVQEQQNDADVQNLLSTLNGIYGPGAYSAAPYVGVTSGGGLPAMVYRSSSVSLVTAPVGIGTVSGSSNARQTIRYQLRPVGYGTDADLYIYASHLKASNTSADAARRNAEVITNRADADDLGPGKNIIYAGDFNLYDGMEPAFETLTAAGNGQAIDPVHAPLNWTGSANRVLFSQSPATVAAYGGQAVGGMNDRFDFQLSSNNLNDGAGLAYIPGSYRAFGNNGSQPLSGAINDASNTYSNSGLTVPASTLLDALTTASDHVPVVAEYQLPARMSVSVSAIPSQVIAGASVPVNVTVTNGAAVSTANGADKLAYSVSGSGDLAGGATGTATATLGGNSHQLNFSTNSAGVKSGVVTAISTSQAAADAQFSQPVSTTVLGHANPSFSSGSISTFLAIDFGIHAMGLPVGSQSFSLHNVADVSGFTAGLDLNAIVGTGNTSSLVTTLSPFLAQPVGSQEFSASLNTSSVGNLSAAYLLLTSDEDLPGAAARPLLTLHLYGIVALGGDDNLDGKVDVSDLLALATHWQQSGDWACGDFNADGMVNSADLAMLAANWQVDTNEPPIPLPAGAVPEPAGLILSIVCLQFCSARHRRH